MLVDMSYKEAMRRENQFGMIVKIELEKKKVRLIGELRERESLLPARHRDLT